MLHHIKSQSQRFSHAIRGIIHATLHDQSFQLQVIGGAIILPLFIYFFSPMTQTELFFLVLGWVLILITELQNSSFEEALDRLHPEMHESIGKSKDMASGAVLFAGLFLLFVMVQIAFF